MSSPSERFQSVIPGATWTRFQPRVRFVLPFLIAAGLLWTGFSRLRPALAQSTDLALQLARLTASVEQAEQTVRGAEAEQVESRVAGSREALMHDETEVDGWLRDIESTVRSLGWELKSEPGNAVSRRMGGIDLVRIPVRLVVRPASARDDEPMYPALLRIGEAIIRDSRRVDLTGIAVRAPEGGLPDADFHIELWLVASDP